MSDGQIGARGQAADWRLDEWQANWGEETNEVLDVTGHAAGSASNGASLTADTSARRSWDGGRQGCTSASRTRTMPRPPSL